MTFHSTTTGPRSDGSTRLRSRTVKPGLLQRRARCPPSVQIGSDPLRRMLHAESRLLLELRPRDHVSSALYALHWLSISQRIDSKLYVNKQSINRTCSSIFDGNVDACADISSNVALRSHYNGDYVIPRTSVKFGIIAFSGAAPRAGNCLSTTLELMRWTYTLKCYLKTILFDIAYNELEVQNIFSGYVLRLRTICRRRTTSECCNCSCRTVEFLDSENMG